MRDPRFVPIEKREPMEEDDDFSEIEDEELSDIMAGYAKKPGVKKTQLFMAS